MNPLDAFDKRLRAVERKNSEVEGAMRVHKEKLASFGIGTKAEAEAMARKLTDDLEHLRDKITKQEIELDAMLKEMEVAL